MSPRSLQIVLPYATKIQRLTLEDALNANLIKVSPENRQHCEDENHTIVELLARDPVQWCKAFAILWKTQPEPEKVQPLFNLRKRRVTAFQDLYESIPGVLGCVKFEFLRYTIRRMMFDRKLIKKEDIGNRPYWIKKQYPDCLYEYEQRNSRTKSDEMF